MGSAELDGRTIPAEPQTVAELEDRILAELWIRHPTLSDIEEIVLKRRLLEILEAGMTDPVEMALRFRDAMSCTEPDD